MSATMLAALFEDPGRIEMVRRERPQPRGDEVLVRVMAAGLCAGDMYIYKGTNPYVSFPRVAGHEIAGEVAALGEEAEGLRVGQQVVVEPFIGCGRCYACRIGKYNCCADLQIIGIHRHGGFAEYVTAPARKVAPLPEGMGLYMASFAEPVAIGVQACRRGAVEASDTVFVLGAGPIGLAVLEAARARRAAVYVTDIAPERLKTAERLGGIAIPAGEALAGAVGQITAGEGMPVVIEAAGAAAAMESTIHLVANGGRIVIVGLLPLGRTIAFPGLDVTRKEVTLTGSRASADCFPESLDLLTAGKIRYPEVGVRFPLRKVPEAMATVAADAGALHKVVCS